MTARITKKAKKSTESKPLFTKAIAKILAAREQELNDGKGIEIRNLSELRKRRIRGKAGASK